MVPADVDIQNLADQLKDDGVAFTNPELAGAPDVQAPIIGALADGHGIAVVDVVPDSVADSRDIAQELKDLTGLDTVIVQTPINVSAVSDTYGRADIEASQQALGRGLDQVSLLEQFYGGLDSFGIPWMAIMIVVSILALIAAGAAFIAASRRGPGV